MAGFDGPSRSGEKEKEIGPLGGAMQEGRLSVQRFELHEHECEHGHQLPAIASFLQHRKPCQQGKKGLTNERCQ